MKKVGCAKCGGTMKKGGSTTNKLNNPKGYAPAQKGGDNTKMGIYGVPNAGRTDSLGFKKGGSVKNLPKAKDGIIVSNSKKGRSTSNGKNFDAYENNKTGILTISNTSRNPSNSSKGVRNLTVVDNKGNTSYKKEDVKFTKNPANNLIKDYNTVRKSAGLPEKKYRDITTSSAELKKQGLAQKAKGIALKNEGAALKADGKTLKAAGKILNKQAEARGTFSQGVKDSFNTLTSFGKAKFGASVPVKHNPPVGMKHNSDHTKLVSVAKAKKGGAVKKYAKGGSLKAVPSDKVNSLGKLPTAVRNKMGFQKKGGAVKKK
jgi:hypothetical protein